MLQPTTTFPLGDGTRVPCVGLGTYLMSNEEAERACLTAFKLGYRHVDTAQGYKNEAGVGKAIRASALPRSSIYITTKLWPGNDAWGMPITDLDTTIKCCEDSVKALGVDYIDLYLIHAPFAFATSLDAGLSQWKACLELKKRGICRSVGVSNFDISHLEAIQDAGLELPSCNQLEIHPLCQQEELIAWMKEKNIAVIA